MRRIALAGLIAACVCAAPAEAQVARQPTRPSPGLFGGGRPVDPNHTRHELTLTGNAMGGYGDALPTTENGPIDPTTAAAANSIFTDAALQYWYGKAARSISSDLRGFATIYRGIDVPPIVGGNLGLSGTTEVGRKNTLSFTQGLSYEPSLALGGFSALSSDVDSQLLPDSGVGSGLTNQRSWSSSSGVTAMRRWTPRFSTSGNLSYLRRTYLDEFGFDGDTRGADGRVSWNVTRVTSIEGSYRYSQARLEEANGHTRPQSDHAMQASVNYSRRLSATRRISFSGGGGANFVRSINSFTQLPNENWIPSAQGSVRLDLGRSWSVGGDYRRAASLLQGVTVETFATDAASIRTDGRIGRRIDLAFSTAFANGRSVSGEAVGRFNTYGGTAQLRYALAACCALSTTYDYYYYELTGIADLPSALPAQYDRNTIRVGLAVRVPLYGGAAPPARRGRETR